MEIKIGLPAVFHIEPLFYTIHFQWTDFMMKIEIAQVINSRIGAKNKFRVFFNILFCGTEGTY